MVREYYQGKKVWWVYLLAVTIVWALCFGQSVAQEQDEAKSTSSEKAVIIQDPKISPASLKIILRPLTAVELEVELSAWLDLLQDKAIELSQVELALVDPSKKSEIQDNNRQTVKLDEEKSALIVRLRQVIAAASAKGVDTKSADLYVRNVGAIPAGGGFRTLASVIKNWFLSPEGGIKFVKSVGLFLLCVLIALTLGRIGSRALNNALKRTGRTSDLLRSFLVSSIRRVALVVGVVIGLSYLGVNVGPMVAAIGGVGFVVGFALKDSLGNFAAGLMILFYRPFDVGDFVKTAGVSGTVESLSLVSTVLRTSDNQEVIVPNGKIWDDVITNVTARDTRRVDLVFGVGYDDDLNQAQSILEGILEKHDLVLEDPVSVVKVNELADSSINFIVRPWAKTSDYLAVRWDITRQVKEAFDEAGISIPYPQQDVHLIK